MLHRHSGHRTFRDCFFHRTDGTSALAPDSMPPVSTEQNTVPSTEEKPLSVPPIQPDKTVLAADADSASDSDFLPEETPLSYTEEPSPTDTDEEGSYYSVGMASVKKDSDLPKANNQHILPAASGIVYEIAEELYCREKTAAEIEALCQPPFRKVFDSQRMEQLDRQATEETRRLLGEPLREQQKEEEAQSARQKPLSLMRAFRLQLLLLIPVVNVAAALILGFRQESNIHVRQYCRAFLLGTAVCMTAALTFFAVNYFADPAHYAFFDRIRLLFGA